MRALPLALFLATSLIARAELTVPAFTAYLAPEERGAKLSSKTGISDWTDPKTTVLWFGELKQAGKLSASLKLTVPIGKDSHLRLKVGTEAREVKVSGNAEAQTVKFGEFTIAKAGYTKFELSSLNPSGNPAGDIDALVLDGPALQDAHFNVEPRRNAASVHLKYEIPQGKDIAVFYNEAVGVEDPVATYYMACGFARGYFGMQVNSPTERRIIFSVWDSGAGTNAKDRSEVASEDHVALLSKGDGVVASGFGNEGTGGHSHLTYPWKTGSTQRFAVVVAPEGANTIYTGLWFNPDQKAWQLIASFRAPKDGKYLRGLYSFSENFGGGNGHLQRKALFGPGWLRDKDGNWSEITEAAFSHDPTGKTARLDRFMGVENGRFFLSNGGFVPGFSKYGEKFTRAATGKPPVDLDPVLKSLSTASK